MADHVRKQIRVAAKTALTGLATTGARVFPSRVYPLEDGELPALRIYTNDETIQPIDVDTGYNQERQLELVIEACSKNSAGMDDELDLMIKEVEVKMSQNPQLAGAQYQQLKEIHVEMLGEGEKPIGVARIVYEVTYFSGVGTPDVVI